MKRNLLLGALVITILLNAHPIKSLAQNSSKSQIKLRKLILTQLLQKQGKNRNVRVAKNDDGYVDFICSPTDGGFEVTGADPTDSLAVAQRFLAEWGDILVNRSPSIKYSLSRVTKHGALTTVRLNQIYDDLKLFKAQVALQIDDSGRVHHLLSGLVSDTSALDEGRLSLRPTLSKEEASKRTIDTFSNKLISSTDGKIKTSEPELVLYSPKVVTGEGPILLCWQVTVEDASQSLSELFLINSHTGEVTLHYPLYCSSKYREIYGPPWGELRRSEGEDETGADMIDLPYAIAGDLYDFFYDKMKIDNVGRDSFDDAGGTIAIKVYSSTVTQWVASTPPYIQININELTDDIIAHELTHGVTFDESELIYSAESGAICESFSDTWGEWFDQQHNYVNVFGYNNDDTTSSKWIHGEDVSGYACRNMKNPPDITCPYSFHPYPYPDRYKKPTDWYFDNEDYGGVHINSSVGNKLSYLLTAGGTFNGFTISGFELDTACALYYMVQLNIVQNSKCFFKMYDALIAAAATTGTYGLNFTETQRLNLEKACQAVNIRHGTGKGVLISNDTATTVALFEDTGKLNLKRALTENVEGNIDVSHGGFIIRNAAGTVVAFIDTNSAGGSDGAMQIKGTISENVIPGESASYIWVLRYQGVVVAAIDNNGNLMLWGVVYQNSVNEFE